MANPVVLLMAVVVLATLTVGHGALVTLPRLVLSQLGIVWRTFGPAAGTAATSDGEPAIPAYFRVTALRDLRAAWWDGLDEHTRLMSDAERFMDRCVRELAGLSRHGARWGQRFLTVVLVPLLVATMTAVVLTATALSLLPLLFSLLFWALCCALWTLWWVMWAAVERAGRALRHGSAPCPYTRCGRTVVRPVRLCPRCGARHGALTPNRYGALYHRCRCGARLPAVLGVRRLDASCPHCRDALPAGYERARVVVLVGGPREQRSGVHRQGLAELGAPPGSEPPLVRSGPTPLLWYDPAGDAYRSQESVARLDVLGRADGLLLVVDDPAAHGDAVHAVTRVLHVLSALPARRRPRRLALLYTRAARGGDTDVRAALEAADGGHLLRALDTTGVPVRCVPASSLAGILQWLAGTRGATGPGGSIAPPPVRRAAGVTVRLPRHRVARHSLLAAHLAGFLAVPLVLVLLQAGVLPLPAFLGLSSAYDKWRHPLTGSVHQVDLMATATRDWPRLSTSYAAPGHPPSAALPGHAGYWSVTGSPHPENWLRVDFGMPLPLSEVSVDFDPDSVDGPFGLSVGLEGQVGASTVRDYDSGGWHNRTVGSGNKYGLGKTYGYDIRYRHTVDSIRIGLGSPYDKGRSKKLRLREFSIRWTSSDALRLHPADGGRLRIENTTARDLAIVVRPPLLPAGWHAVLVGRPPRVLRAEDTYEARWRITAPSGAEGRVPLAYAVDAGEDGHTVTSRCLALLTAAGRSESLC
ncbi:discoidin domain-containing protein [Streptomyces sp. NPDC046759]|uniref:discoidin domain-containing protein n=1 Tax=Streptomyces sp. NPDC046759 TaxID=3155019 RepID=UPI0033F30FAC